MLRKYLKSKLNKIKLLVSSRTIQFELMVALVCISLVPAIIINQFYFNKTETFVEEKVKSYNSEIIRQTGEKLGFILKQIDIAKKQIIATTVSQEYFAGYNNKTRFQKLEMQEKILNLLKNIKTSFPEIADIFVLNFDGTVYSTSLGFDKSKLMDNYWMKNASKTLYQDIVIPTYTPDYQDVQHRLPATPVISFVKNFTALDGTGNYGVIQIDLKYSELQEVFHNINLDEGADLLVLDSKDMICYSNHEGFQGMGLKDISIKGLKLANPDDFSQTKQNRYTYFVDYHLEGTGWRVLGILPMTGLYAQLSEGKTVSLLVTLIVFIFSFFVSFLISRGITKPINKVIRTMKKVGKGDFQLIEATTGNRDLQVLSNGFNSMVNQMNYLIKNMVEKENEKTQAQLKALQAQINPHFLYNTLEVVRSLAYDYNADCIADISKSLAKMFRYNISKDKDIVTIREEIEHIKNYIRIQKYRYKDKFDVVYDLEEDILEYSIIKLILQPLVENAVYHGIEMKMGKGIIKISAWLESGDIRIKITDDGLGIPQDKLDKINKALRGEILEENIQVQSDVGIGIVNVNTRIKLYYGEKYGLCFKSVYNSGTTVDISIPAIPKDIAGPTIV